MDNNKEHPQMRSPSKSTSEDYNLQLPAWSIEYLRKAATQLELPRPRSLAWSLLLNVLPPPHSDIRASLQTHRSFYNDLRVKLSMDPRAVIDDDPLSQSDESAWKQHFCDNELKALILQDVVRTFPDEMYFRDKDVQDLMVRVLFFWARSHSHIGYRQGMHEILAPLLFELYLDRQYAPEGISDSLKLILDENFLEHDSYMLFSGVMKGIERFYTTGDVAPTSCGRMPVTNSIHNPNEVVRYLGKVRDEYLMPLDRELAMHLASCNITMELFGIRWLRLLFGREFPRSEIPYLWGYLFADGQSLPYIHYVIVAMLISMRRTHGEPGVVLSALMRPGEAPARHVAALARHLRSPQRCPRPRTPPPPSAPASPPAQSDAACSPEWLEHLGSESASTDCSCVEEGDDIARELAALRVLRAALPRAVRSLRRALPQPGESVARPLSEIIQLTALLQCRNHALIDVETAMEAAEGQTQHTDYNNIGKKQLLPVAIIGGKHPKKQVPQTNNIKEVQLKVFNQTECKNTSDFPCLDPLRLRTE